MKIDTYWYIRTDYHNEKYRDSYDSGKYVDLTNHYTGEILVTMRLDEGNDVWRVSYWQEGCFDGFIESDTWDEMNELTKKLFKQAYRDIYDTDLEGTEEDIPC